MPYPIDNKLVIAVSSTALFDLSAEHHLYKQQGVDTFREYQRHNRQNIPAPGAAFPFIQRMLNLNSVHPDEQPVEVVILSRNHADAGLRVLDAVEHYELPVSRAFFLAGSLPYPYMESIGAVLYLSTNKQEVKNAMQDGFPAGYVLECTELPANDDRDFRIAFDFDGVIADDESERVYKDTGNNLDLFHEHEQRRREEPLGDGPLMPLLKRIITLQTLGKQKSENMNEYVQHLRIAIVTARNAPAHERIITTLREAGIDIDELFLLGGIEKKRVLEVLRPHIYFDDQIDHLELLSGTTPAVHVPFGIANL